MKETLSDCIEEVTCGRIKMKVVATFKIKDKIQNAQRRIKTEIGTQYYYDKAYQMIIKILNKIFKEEFGPKLT